MIITNPKGESLEKTRFKIRLLNLITTYTMTYRDLTENKWDIQHHCYKYDMLKENSYIHTEIQIWNMDIDRGPLFI